MEYREAYRSVKSAGDRIQELLAANRALPDGEQRLQRVAEMVLVRHLDDWWFGDPQSNISRAIRLFCERVAVPDSRPPTGLQVAASFLAWAYHRLDHSSDDAYLLLEHVMAFVAPAEDDPLIDEPPWPDLIQALRSAREARDLPPYLDELTVDERCVWHEIARWELGTTGGLSSTAGKAEEATGRTRRKFVQIVSEGLETALSALRETGDRLVSDRRLFEAVRRRGYQVGAVEELREVPLGVLDPLSRRSSLGGEALGAIEGGVTGAGGLLLAAVDVPTLLVINLRFISQIAHTYGYRTGTTEEQAFLLNVLGVSAATSQLRGAFLSNLNRLAMELAMKGTVRQLDQHAFLVLLRRVAERIGIRLTERALGRAIPVASAAVGAAMNYAYTRDNLAAARMMYRKRRLIERCAPR